MAAIQWLTEKLATTVFQSIITINSLKIKSNGLHYSHIRC
jgi:hypothetical protein